MNLIIATKLLPHSSSRYGAEIDALILHYPAPNLEDPNPYSTNAVHALLDREKLSYHYFIDKEGLITQFVDTDRAAWHAGKALLFGATNVNQRSIGICLANNGGEPYRKEQLKAAGDLCRYLSENFRIPMNRIVGHVHVSPDRKVDPGPKFPWYEFFRDYMA